jgi:hypothetical protein
MGLEMKLTVRPLTPDLWPALEDLFGKNGACNGCWCMYWRIGSAYKKRPADNNKMAFRRTVNQGPPPGLLAFHGALAVGWCQLTPRSALPWIDRSWRLKRVDEIPPALEAYPFDAGKSPSASGTGYRSTFVRAGFKNVACRTPARPIMRYDLTA